MLDGGWDGGRVRKELADRASQVFGRDEPDGSHGHGAWPLGVRARGQATDADETRNSPEGVGRVGRLPSSSHYLDIKVFSVEGLERDLGVVMGEGSTLTSYPIAVVVPSTRGWPSMRLSMESVLPQVSLAGGQLIVADSSGLPVPAEFQTNDVLWLRMPGVASYELHQAAYRRADAPIVAITEDQCSVADGWVSGILAAHAADPEAAMIFGAVENGSGAHLIDWALYCVGYAAWAPPLDADNRSNPGHASVSWKRWALDRLPAGGDRVMEFRYVAALRAAGERTVSNDALRVRHFQCDRVRPTSLSVTCAARATVPPGFTR